MGSPDGDEEATSGEQPRHQVRLNEGYWLAETEVTQELWQVVMDYNSSEFMGDTRPVHVVYWDDAQAFLEALNNQVPGVEARLPTEAQWEYAARAGTETPRYGPPDQVAWYDDNSDFTPQPVGTKAPNAWGLYDMLGNVAEWCRDYYEHYGDRMIPGAAIEDPTGPAEGGDRVVRGGSWVNDARHMRAAHRSNLSPMSRVSDIGLRLSRGP
ncbi:MAG: formylglycine-generating enzyme family protein [Myxococcales bacterium]|nr:formylglycine-generating enzyme family protein [Myxococcales bacterium]